MPRQWRTGDNEYERRASNLLGHLASAISLIA